MLLLWYLNALLLYFKCLSKRNLNFNVCLVIKTWLYWKIIFTQKEPRREDEPGIKCRWKGDVSYHSRFPEPPSHMEIWALKWAFWSFLQWKANNLSIKSFLCSVDYFFVIIILHVFMSATQMLNLQMHFPHKCGTIKAK